MNKITSYSADYQTFSSLFELEPVAGKKVTVDFSAPKLSSLGGLSLVREYEKSSNSIIDRFLSEKPCGARKCGPIGQLLRRQRVVAMNNAV